ncbi:TIGR02594 family protein [Acinetobacter sp. CFCC 10889]|uniref:TIGR02594 family protein n=1 Tax=Acinetobacter sp. CFCC 10889 TaxID=1775557 RepID=UPI00148E7A3C|nr:TIGR02594 family protein [Acinetobacter sp. CFCC 10889]
MTKQSELSWVAVGRTRIGTHEVKGAKHSPLVLSMWDVSFKATGQKTWIKDDETAWCGGFIGYCFAQENNQVLIEHIPKDFYRAKSWANSGTALKKPAYGCVVVFSRTGGGHVGIVVGKDKHGNIMVLGGNQSDAVNIKPFSTSRVLAYRWCGTQKNPLASRYDLPVLDSNGKVSTNEA